MGKHRWKNPSFVEPRAVMSRLIPLSFPGRMGPDEQTLFHSAGGNHGLRADFRISVSSRPLSVKLAPDCVYL